LRRLWCCNKQSVCLFAIVCLQRSGTVSKRPNLSSKFLYCRVEPLFVNVVYRDRTTLSKSTLRESERSLQASQWPMSRNTSHMSPFRLHENEQNLSLYCDCYTYSFITSTSETFLQAIRRYAAANS